MPDRPKRRKNNKNKRKNKNNRQDHGTVNEIVKQVDSSKNESNTLKKEDNLPEENILNESSQITTTISDNQTNPSDVTENECAASQVCNQDLNNNSNEIVTEAIPIIVETANNVLPDEQQQDLLTSNQENENYMVESPEQSLKTKPKQGKVVKSKSLDDDEIPKIVEVTGDSSVQSEEDTSLNVIDSNNVLVTDVESDVEWEKLDELPEETKHKENEIPSGELFSVTTIPLTMAKCEQAKSLTPEEEKSLRDYLQTLDLATQPENTIEIKAEIEQIINREIKQRLRKKGLADDFFCQRLGPPRTLDVIDEEGSGESSLASRRQSYLSDKKSDNEDLDDDVFEDKKKVIEKYMAKSSHSLNKHVVGRLVPQQCVLVGAKMKEPDVTEARGDWTVQTVEKMGGAEVIYLTDTSSSTSSLYDNGEETDDGGETDVSVRMITPTIEVTDTDNFLKKTFISKTNDSNFKGTEEDSNVNNDNLPPNVSNSDFTAENPHEIVVLSTDDIKTTLYVKDVDESQNGNIKEEKHVTKNDEEKIISEKDKYEQEIKVLKNELNDALNNLIKEVSSDSENGTEHSKDNISRQDSTSSVASSQCTAKYNPTSTSLNDISNLMHDEIPANTTQNNSAISHVKDVFECVAGTPSKKVPLISKQPLQLRDICLNKISAFPFGDKILEELASVSKRLQNNVVGTENVESVKEIAEEKTVHKTTVSKSSLNKMPYFPLPDLSTIEKVCLPAKHKDPIPPPIQPRNSSLKKTAEVKDDPHWTAIPTKTEPVYVCLSPSQKMLMEKTNTVITKEDASQLVDMHTKYVDRRGYSESDAREYKKEHEVAREPPVIPFKSQTGSRLLALIRDPTVTSNIHSNLDKNYNRSADHVNRGFHKSAQYSSNYERLQSLTDLTRNFKPIPPPRPRKFSSSFYESDESSDFTDSSLRSMRSERKYFHYSTGTLNKEIENDVSSIQNMHRYCRDIRDKISEQNYPRRPSLPKDLCDQQMEYIRQKEKEVEAEIQRLEEQRNKASNQRKGPRAPLIKEEKEVTKEKLFNDSSYFGSKKNEDFTHTTDKNDKTKLSSVFSSSQEEILRDKMYSEYMSQMAERQTRREQKVIKITNPTPTVNVKDFSKSLSALEVLDTKVNNRIEKEFISKARERWDKLGIKDPETEDERDRESKNDVYREPKVIEHKIKVIDGGEEKDVQKLPNHLQEFVRFAAKNKETGAGSPAVWRPGAPTPPPSAPVARSPAPPPPPPPPVWTPGSAGASPQSPRKNFRPVHFEETPPARRKFSGSEQNGCTSGSESEGRLRTSHSAPATGLNSLGTGPVTSRLPRAQNPTVTLLQKAREGQIPRGSSYLQEERDSARLPRDRASPPRGDPVHALRREYASEGEADRSDYERGGIRKMADANKERKVEGIGPMTRDGMPVALRSEVKDPSKWYKKMYDTIHKNKYDDDYVTIRYKSRRGQPPERVTGNKSQYAYFDPRSGYLSEPEGGLGRLGYSTWTDVYDSDATSGPRRRTASVQEERRVDDVSSPYLPSNNKYSTLASARASHEVYKNQPGRIENYVPGKSSVVDKETKQWWDEVMDIFDGQISSTSSLPQPSPKEKKDITSAILSKSNMAKALKESGYESDSTLVFRRRSETEGPLSPAERRAAYRDLQAGGEPPLRGFRSPAPPRHESPRRYVESDVNIHYRCPVRHDPLPLVPERELARQQAEHMKRLYREQRRNKYLQELQDMQNRRHQDNFTPAQKSIVPLNRYDEAERMVARALFAFNGQTPRELSFRKGDMINVRRQIDNNWYEGELHGRIGLFPYNYVEILKGDITTAKKPAVVEGRAKAKFDFTAQTNLELPLKKGEVVVLTRRIDQNWWEGRLGNNTGIFPDSYVTVLQEPTQNKPAAPEARSESKPAASPAAHGLVNGAAKRALAAHSYTPQHNSAALANAPPATQPLPGYVAKPAQATMPQERRGAGLNNTEPLYVDTNAEAVPYRAMYKYRPQNPDELELSEGDTVYVLEKCDDGWYVGSSQRTGRFGTFPGNYVERI